VGPNGTGVTVGESLEHERTTVTRREDEPRERTTIVRKEREEPDHKVTSGNATATDGWPRA